MNNVERLKRVKELLEPFKHVEMGVHVPGKPVCPTSGAYYSSWDDGEYMAKQALTIIDELIDQQAKGVDVLTEVEMAQVAGVLFNAGHEELSKKTYSALKAGQPKDQYNSGDVFVWDGVTLRPWYSMPVEVLEMVLEWETAGKPTQPKAPSERGVLTEKE